MTALNANPPVFLHPLADRYGSPAGLLLELGACGHDLPVPPLPEGILTELAGGAMNCYFRAGQSEAMYAALAAAGWQPLAADKLHRAELALGPGLPALADGVLWVEGDWFLAPPAKAVGKQVADRALALRLVQLVSADADTHEIEALLRQDPTLSYHLLRLVNSLGMGSGRRITSFSQAILILGRSQLRRWLNLMLFSSREGDTRAAMLLTRVAVRARSMELLARDAGQGKLQQEQAFMVGMFSMLGVLFGMPLAEVLQPLTLGESALRALLEQHGELGHLLALVEAAERDDHAALLAALQTLQIDRDNYNRVVAEAYLWMQTVTSGKTGRSHA